MSDNHYKSIFERRKALDRLDSIEERFDRMYVKNKIKSLMKDSYFTSVKRRINALAVLRNVLDEEPSEYNFKAVAQMSKILDETKGNSRLPRSISKLYGSLRREIEDYKIGKIEHITEHLQSIDDKISEAILDRKPKETIDSQISDFSLIASYGFPKSTQGRNLSLKFSSRLERYDELIFTGTDAEGLYDMMEGNDGESTRN